MDLDFCFQGGLVPSWHCPLNCHFQAGSAVVLGAHGTFPWISHFLLPWQQKTCFGEYGGKFQALAVEDRNCMSFYTDNFESRFWRVSWAANTSLRFWWSTMIKQASQYLCYIQGSFQFIVYKYNGVCHAETIVYLNNTFFIDIASSGGGF